jgi:hypothetical protein
MDDKCIGTLICVNYFSLGANKDIDVFVVIVDVYGKVSGCVDDGWMDDENDDGNGNDVTTHKVGSKLSD